MVEWFRTVIEPVGIETHEGPKVSHFQILTVIEPVGIETHPARWALFF